MLTATCDPLMAPSCMVHDVTASATQPLLFPATQTFILLAQLFFLPPWNLSSHPLLPTIFSIQAPKTTIFVLSTPVLRKFFGTNILVIVMMKRYIMLINTPIDWLRSWLTKHNVLDIPDKYGMVDQEGELFHNPKFRILFHEFGYCVEPTDAGSSLQNCLVERPHQRPLATPYVSCSLGPIWMLVSGPKFGMVRTRQLICSVSK